MKKVGEKKVQLKKAVARYLVCNADNSQENVLEVQPILESTIVVPASSDDEMYGLDFHNDCV